MRSPSSELTEPFWNAAARHVLMRQVCDECGKNIFTPQIACPRCLSQRLTWTPSSGVGRVYSYTICHRGPTSEFETPYVLAIVDLDDGWSMLSNVVGCPTESVRIGLAVEVDWVDLEDDVRSLPVFRPRASA